MATLMGSQKVDHRKVRPHPARPAKKPKPISPQRRRRLDDARRRARERRKRLGR